MTLLNGTSLESLSGATGDITQVGVNFTRRRSKNQCANRIPSHFNILKRPQNVNSSVCQYDSGAGRILNCKLCFPVFTSDSTDCSRQMVAMQGLYVFDLERFHKQIVHSQQCQTIGNVKSKRKCKHKVGRFLQESDFCCERRCFDLDAFGAGVESDLKMHLFN